MNCAPTWKQILVHTFIQKLVCNIFSICIGKSLKRHATPYTPAPNKQSTVWISTTSYAVFLFNYKTPVLKTHRIMSKNYVCINIVLNHLHSFMLGIPINNLCVISALSIMSSHGPVNALRTPPQTGLCHSEFVVGLTIRIGAEGQIPRLPRGGARLQRMARVCCKR